MAIFSNLITPFGQIIQRETDFLSSITSNFHEKRNTRLVQIILILLHYYLHIHFYPQLNPNLRSIGYKFTSTFITLFSAFVTSIYFSVSLLDL